MVESRTGAVALVFRWVLAALSLRPLSPAWHSSDSCSRSANRTCRFPASGFLPFRQTFALDKSARRFATA
jgi:hypothetical protein